MNRARLLQRSTIGKKALLAVSGLVLIGFVVVHMLANLQIFPMLGGHDRLDGYARALHGAPALLWGARAVLAGCALAHVAFAVQLWRRQRAARPMRYHRRPDLQASLASRTMIVSGALLAVFVPVHLANLTWGWLHPRFVPLAAYENVVALFRSVPVSIFYLLALAALALHLAHGAASLFPSLGLGASPRAALRRRRLAAGFGVAIAAGFASVVLAVLIGRVR